MMRRLTTYSRKHNQRGLTLVETIVAVLLVASCVIGIAAIYAQRQNVARGGRLHARAVELAQQIATKIGANTSAKNNFETALGATCNTKPSQADNATNLVACWQDMVEQELTDGSARVSLDRSTVPAQYVIVVSWSEPRSGTASYVLRVNSAGANKTDNPKADKPVTIGPAATREAG